MHMDCPKCSSPVSIKDGIVRGLQRYLCKSCRYHYTVQHRSGTGTIKIKRKALQLYLEGLSLRSIGRILNFSNVTILNWMRSFGKEIDNQTPEQPAKVAEVVEMDEMHSYVKSKKKRTGYGSQLIDVKNVSSTV